MTTVACVLRSGGDFTVEYVERLRGAVERHLPEADFVCLSDVEVPARRIPLVTDWPGWWAKLELFRPGLFPGQVLYFDLDTVITGSLAALAAHRHRFTVATNWLVPGGLNSAAMAWSGDWRHLFERFHPGRVREFRGVSRHGDQGYIQAELGEVPERFDDLFPGAMVSYKIHDQAARAAASVVLFHGRPRPHEVGWRV